MNICSQTTREIYEKNVHKFSARAFLDNFKMVKPQFLSYIPYDSWSSDNK
jgi:hypothetical protein